MRSAIHETHCSATTTAKRGIAGRIGCASLLLAAQLSVASSGVLLVANSNDEHGREAEGYISFVDPDTGKVVAKVPDGGVTAHEIVVSLDGKYAFAPIYSTANIGAPGTDGSTISVIDIAARKVVDTIDVGRGVRPHHGAVSAKDGLIYITAETDQSVLIVDPAARRVIGSIPTGQPESHNVVVSRDGQRAYTSNVFEGTVSVLDVPARKLVQIIRVTDAPSDRKSGGRSRDDWKVQRIALSNDDRRLFTCDWATSELVTIDTASNRIDGRLHMVSPCYGITPTPDGKNLLISNAQAGKLSVVDLRAFKVIRIIDVPLEPQAIQISPDGQTAYVSCSTDKKVAVIRLADWTTVKSIPTGYWPDGLAWGGVDLR